MASLVNVYAIVYLSTRRNWVHEFFSLMISFLIIQVWVICTFNRSWLIACLVYLLESHNYGLGKSCKNFCQNPKTNMPSKWFWSPIYKVHRNNVSAHSFCLFNNYSYKVVFFPIKVKGSGKLILGWCFLHCSMFWRI